MASDDNLSPEQRAQQLRATLSTEERQHLFKQMLLDRQVGLFPSFSILPSLFFGHSPCSPSPSPCVFVHVCRIMSHQFCAFLAWILFYFGSVHSCTEPSILFSPLSLFLFLFKRGLVCSTLPSIPPLPFPVFVFLPLTSCPAIFYLFRYQPFQRGTRNCTRLFLTHATSCSVSRSGVRRLISLFALEWMKSAGREEIDRRSPRLTSFPSWLKSMLLSGW